MGRTSRTIHLASELAKKSLLAVVLLTALHSALAHGAERWKIQFFHDKLESSLDLRDLQCPSVNRCIAAGVLQERKGEPKGTAVVTSDAGEHWSYVDLKEVPVSLFFLNDSVGWMVTVKGIWHTEESGRTWKKVKAIKGIERVWFQSETHGWAVGYPKAIYETTDGGKEWTKVPAALKQPTPVDQTNYTGISFAGPQTGLIAGNWTPGLHEGIPAWMDPANERRRFMKRSTTILLLTRNSGKDWESINRSSNGYPTRIHLAGADLGFALFEFPGSDSPSSLFKLDLKTQQVSPVFQDKGRVARDFTILPGGDIWLAAVELAGKSSQVPIPGKLKMLHSRTLESWPDIPVDYRAVANRPVISAADATHIWVATDTGMILKLIQ
ncbi:MAG: YCF48-related protein [Acidobacteriota bacterium]|nr:YCF48-related protein [Acidobacteriota bacterium]